MNDIYHSHLFNGATSSSTVSRNYNQIALEKKDRPQRTCTLRDRCEYLTNTMSRHHAPKFALLGIVLLHAGF